MEYLPTPGESLIVSDADSALLKSTKTKNLTRPILLASPTDRGVVPGKESPPGLEKMQTQLDDLQQQQVTEQEYNFNGCLILTSINFGELRRALEDRREVPFPLRQAPVSMIFMRRTSSASLRTISHCNLLTHSKLTSADTERATRRQTKIS